MKLKLHEIVNALPAWTVLGSLKKDPKLAYRLLKYEKKVERELNICAKQRDLLVYEAAGEAPPTPPDIKIVQLAPGTPGHGAFMEKYTAFLEGESDLDVIGLSMDELIEALSAQAGNVLSENDIELLEPFFRVAEAAVA